jgi:hypothetical protein
MGDLTVSFHSAYQPIGTYAASADRRLFVGKSFVALEIQLCAQLAGVTAQVVPGSQLTHQGRRIQQ